MDKRPLTPYDYIHRGLLAAEAAMVSPSACRIERPAYVRRVLIDVMRGYRLADTFRPAWG